MGKRAHISLKTKLAAALLTMVRPGPDGKMAPVIPFEKAKTMTAEQVISCFHFDHDDYHAESGNDHHSNLTPRPVAEHREKTAKIDNPRIAKNKRLSENEEAFRARLLAKSEGTAPAPAKRKSKSNFPSRPFPKRIKRR